MLWGGERGGIGLILCPAVGCGIIRSVVVTFTMLVQAHMPFVFVYLECRIWDRLSSYSRDY